MVSFGGDPENLRGIFAGKGATNFAANWRSCPRILNEFLEGRDVSLATDRLILC